MPRQPLNSLANAHLLGRILGFTPIVIGGVLLVVSALRGFVTPRRSILHTLDDLRRWIPGRSKRDVAALLGPPRTVRALGDESAAPAYIHTDTWYYALEETDHSAIAVIFGENVVRRVEFFRIEAVARD
jgi:outer membrane protein assembly factor BamE (lipoprotein component of BamABCDE complex)